MALKGFGGGGGGGLGNMAGLMGQLQQAQKKIAEDAEKMQETLENARLDGSAGGVAKAVVDGNGALQTLTLSPEAVDPSDVDGLTELIVTAVRQAQEKADALRTDEQQKLMPKGLNIPGLF